MKAHSAIIRALSGGTITAEEAQAISAVLDAWRRSAELLDLEQRLARLEAATPPEPEREPPPPQRRLTVIAR